MYGCKQAPTCPLWQLAPSQTANTRYVGFNGSAIQPDTPPLQSTVSLPLAEASFYTSAAPNPQNLSFLALPNAVIIFFNPSS